MQYSWVLVKSDFILAHFQNVPYKGELGETDSRLTIRLEGMRFGWREEGVRCACYAWDAMWGRCAYDVCCVPLGGGLLCNESFVVRKLSEKGCVNMQRVSDVKSLKIMWTSYVHRPKGGRGWGWIHLSEGNAVKAAKNPQEKWARKGRRLRGEINPPSAA